MLKASSAAHEAKPAGLRGSRLQALERVKDENAREIEREQRERVHEPALLARIDAGEAIERRSIGRTPGRCRRARGSDRRERFHQGRDDGAEEQDLIQPLRVMAPSQNRSGRTSAQAR